VTRYWAEQPGFNSEQTQLFFFLHSTVMSRPALQHTQSPIQWPSGSISPSKVTAAWSSPPTSAKINNLWYYTSILSYIIMTWCLIKHRDNFTCYGKCATLSYNSTIYKIMCSFTKSMSTFENQCNPLWTTRRIIKAYPVKLHKW
jgi:hypothetical protein